MQDIVLLHNHDAIGSLLDSILTPEDIVKFASDNNQKAIAITNHGTMFSFVDFYKACKKYDVKPIIGVETYEVENMFIKDKDEKRGHLVLLAKNQAGLKNIYKIVSDSYKYGFYYKPRIDLNYIQENNLGKGVICLTACQAGHLSRGLSDNKDMKPYFEKLKSIFDYACIEIQSHDTEDQIAANNKIIKFAIKNNYPITITTDSHMKTKDQMTTHEIFVEIGESREVGEMYEGCHLQTAEQVHNYMDKHHGENVIDKAIQETIHIAEMVKEVDIGLNQGNQMPKINIPKGFKSNMEYFKHLLKEGYKNKKINLKPKEDQKIYLQRIKDEIPVLEALDYIDYFIMLYMLAQESNKKNIPRGYSRGSGANCLCLYLLGVTQVDSIKWGLDFSRFANLGRKSVADFDWDISKKRRKEMVEISEELFGQENVAPICTFNTLSTKVAIRDVGKVLDKKGVYKIPYKIRDEVSNLIPTIKTLNDLGEEEEKDVLLKEVLSSNKKLKEYYDKYPLWFKYVMELEGLPKSLGRHAAGTIIAPKPIVEYCPVCLDKDGNSMLQLEMHNAMDDLGLVKMDYLGLKNLDIIDETLKRSGLTWEDVDIDHINLNDKKVYDNIFKKGNTTGVFQMESAEATKMCVNAKADNIEDVIAICAFNRPGTKDSFPTYIKNKKYPDKVELLHDDLKTIFNKTHYVLLYQEQALQIFRHAGFPEEEVDNARRAIGHKEKDTMKKLKVKLIEGLTNIGWTKEQAYEMWDLLEKQAEYSFNRGHSCAYGLLSYLTAYLKYYYPLEFMTSLLNAEVDNISKLSIIINECKNLGINVLPPNINDSKEYFTTRKKTNDILFGIVPIKGVGDATAEVIIENQPYKSFTDFCNKTKGSGKVNKTALIALIKAGAFTINNKKEYLLKYGESLFKKKEYKNVKTTPTLKKLKEDWGIEEDDKSIRLEKYNLKRKEKHQLEQRQKYKKHIENFKNKYMEDEYMWEFETLSMFLTNDPLQKTYKYVKPFTEVENGSKATVINVIVNIKNKKDKNNNKFAYIDLYTPFGIIEAICWASIYRDYQDYIKKGNCVVILGRKNEDKLFVEAIKSFEEWKADKGFN